MTPAYMQTHLEDERQHLRDLGDAMWDEFQVQLFSGRALEELEEFLEVRGHVISAINALSLALDHPWIKDHP
jgi:hypothetical protein